jgi:hypothetical protein
MQVVPAANGAAWLRDGFRLFARNPVVWVALVFAYWALVSVLGLAPYVGTALGLALVPVFSVSFMNVARAAERGQPLAFALLASGFRTETVRLLVLGGIYVAVFVLVMGLTQAADGGVLMRRMLLGESLPKDAYERPEVMHAGVIALLLYAPLTAAFWFAPVLVAWHAHAPSKALFFSFFACLANWRALIVYGIAVTLVAVVLPGFLLTVLAPLFAAGRSGGSLLAFFAVSFYAVIFAVLFASFYASYRDVFPPAPPPLPAAAA